MGLGMIARIPRGHRLGHDMRSSECTPPFILDTWTVKPEFQEISQGEYTRRIEPKVMGVLLHLAAHPMRVVTKEEILGAVWPDTFVSDDALTRCISILRHVLRDDPRHPRFIKTVSKVGYCLLVTTRPLEHSPAITSQEAALSLSYVEEQVASASEADEPVPPALFPVAQSVRPQRWQAPFAALALALVLAVGLAIWFQHASRGKVAALSFATTQATTDPGEQSRPALSPDGKRLAFVWAKDGGSGQQIYWKEVGSGSSLPVGALSAEQFSPVWSHDGRRLAFLAASKAGLALYVKTLSAPAEARQVYTPGEITGWGQGALSWSPDGNSFALADHLGSQPNYSVYRIDMNGKELRSQPLTTPPPGWEGDLNPVFSPDGAKIAFIRASESAVDDIAWIPASGGKPHQITHDGKMVNGIAWSSDSRSIIFSSNRAGEYALWRASLQGGVPERMPVGTEGATQPVVAQNGEALAFVQSSAVFGVLRVPATAEDAHKEKAALLVSSTAQDSAPSISPDGHQFAFQSWRSGSQQIWVGSTDGQHVRQLTPSGGALSGSGSPAWSPDGSRILFDSRLDGHSHIFVSPATGGPPQQITFGTVNDIVPRWSADGRFLYFRSNRGGRWQLWKVPVTGGLPQPMTTEDGLVGQESPDGKWLYFARGGEDGIWRMPAAGGSAERILDQPAAGYWAYWAVSPKGIYFLDQKHAVPEILFSETGTRKITTVWKLERLPPLYSGLSLFPDGHSLLISDKRDAGSHIAMVQGAF